MSSYYANTDLAAYELLQASHLDHVAAWDATVAAIDAGHAEAVAAYEQAHQAWVDDKKPTGEEPTAPPAPSYPEPPQPPQPPGTTYSVREIDTLTQIDTATGTALVLPQRLVVTGPAGDYAMSAEEFAATYTEVGAS